MNHYLLCQIKENQAMFQLRDVRYINVLFKSTYIKLYYIYTNIIYEYILLIILKMLK